MILGPRANPARFAPLKDAGELQSANGNAVNLERELAKIDSNRVRYDTKCGAHFSSHCNAQVRRSGWDRLMDFFTSMENFSVGHGRGSERA